jgi:hypothetical protein
MEHYRPVAGGSTKPRASAKKNKQMEKQFVNLLYSKCKLN